MLRSSSTNGENQFKAHMEEALAQREQQWAAKLQALDTQFQAEKQECQNARDLLIHAHSDIEQLREDQLQELCKGQKELDSASKEIQRLRAQVMLLEGSVKGKDSELGKISVLQRTNENLQREIETTRNEMESMEKMKEQLLTRNKQFEVDIKNLRRELSKRAASSTKLKTTPPPPIPVVSVFDCNQMIIKQLSYQHFCSSYIHFLYFCHSNAYFYKCCSCF